MAPFQLADQRRLTVELLPGNRVLGIQSLIQGEIDLGIFQLGFVLLKLAQGLVELCLIGLGVNACQHVALADLGAFLEQQLLQHTANPAAHHHGVQRADGTDCTQPHIEAALLHRHDPHRGGHAAETAHRCVAFR